MVPYSKGNGIMSIRIEHFHVCDRCKEDFNPRRDWTEKTIGGLSYMVKKNNSGSMDSNMSLDLCQECTVLFLKFMANK